MIHIVLWSSMLIAGFGLAAASLFFVRSRKEREPWLVAGSWYTLVTVLHILYVQVFFYFLAYLDFAPDEFSRQFPLVGMLGMAVASLRVWIFFMLLYRGLAVRARPVVKRIFLAAVVVLWAVQAAFYIARMAGLDGAADTLWTLHQGLEVIIASGYATSLWGLLVWKKSGAVRTKRIIRYSCVITLCALPAFIFSFVVYLAAGLFFLNYIFFCLLSAALFVGSFILNTRAIEEYRFPVPRELPDAMRRAYRLSAREAEIVDRLLEGKRPQQIAQALLISVKTVNTHIQSVYRKCGSDGRPALIELTRKFAPNA